MRGSDLSAPLMPQSRAARSIVKRCPPNQRNAHHLKGAFIKAGRELKQPLRSRRRDCALPKPGAVSPTCKLAQKERSGSLFDPPYSSALASCPRNPFQPSAGRSWRRAWPPHAPAPAPPRRRPNHSRRARTGSRCCRGPASSSCKSSSGERRTAWLTPAPSRPRAAPPAQSSP